MSDNFSSFSHRSDILFDPKEALALRKYTFLDIITLWEGHVEPKERDIENIRLLVHFYKVIKSLQFNTW